MIGDYSLVKRSPEQYAFAPLKVCVSSQATGVYASDFGQRQTDLYRTPLSSCRPSHSKQHGRALVTGFPIQSFHTRREKKLRNSLEFFSVSVLSFHYVWFLDLYYFIPLIAEVERRGLWTAAGHNNRLIKKNYMVMQNHNQFIYTSSKMIYIYMYI